MTKKRETSKNAWNMTGKTVVVTGANRGLGREITKNLVRAGARVVMACRSVDHARRVREEIFSREEPGEAEVWELDLSRPESIREFAESLKKDHPRIDVLIHNAGVSLHQLQRTRSGLELTFATNVLGPQLLNGLMVNSLKRAAPSRVIFVASDFAGNLDRRDLQFEQRRFSGTKAYRQSKQANRMLTREWARRLEKGRIGVNSMTPGLMADTDLFRDSPPGEKRFMRLLGKLIGVTIAQGADTVLWLACDPKLEGETGGFYRRRKKIRCKFADPEAEKKLWQGCEELLQHPEWQKPQCNHSPDRDIIESKKKAP